MNVCIRNTFVSLWLLFGTWSLSAQGASFYFPTINNALTGSNKLMPLKVVNLDSIVALQMVIRWDPSVLKYTTIDQFGLQDLTISDFNTTHALDSGFVRLQWEGSVPESPGISVTDSSTIFRMRFNVIGSGGTCSPVTITEILDFPPLYFEVVKVYPDTSIAYGLNECPRTNGLICVVFPVATGEPQADEIPISLSPNPFSVSSHFQFEIDETTEAQVLVTDALGQTVFEKTFLRLSPGQHGMVIEKSMLGAPGHYTLRLQAGRKTATQQFVLF